MNEEMTLDQRKIETLLTRVENLECQLLAHRATMAMMLAAMNAETGKRFAHFRPIMLTEGKLMAISPRASNLRNPEAVKRDREHYYDAEIANLDQLLNQFGPAT